jgi:predicted NBD/HSP70 family sugar kinase
MKNAINQELMRISNKKAIMQLIQRSSPISKAEISAALGLSSTSVATFINELASENKIIPCGIAKSTGGRRSMLYQTNPDGFYAIGIDLQVDRIVCILTNAIGNIITDKEVQLENKDEWYVIHILNQTIDELCHTNHISLSNIGGIGIGIPGIVKNSTGLIEFAPNLGWQNVNLKQLLQYDKPILIENEANAAAIGEKSLGIAGKNANMLYISIGVGIGCGLFLNNQLFTGHSYHAGEFGHMTVEADGVPCHCGNQGCWEAYASNEAAISRYNQIASPAINTYDDFLERVRQNNTMAVTVLETTIKYLGIGIANLVNGLNPEMVIIGGKITELKDQIYHPLLKQIKDHCLNKAYSGFTLEFSQSKNQGTAIGMVSIVIDAVMNQDAIVGN